jgi:hypothetical protein
MKSGPNTGNCRTSGDPSNVRRTRIQRSFILHVTDPAKVVAQKIEASHRTVEAHRMALPQNWDQLIDYCRHYPGFALDVAIEMGLEFDRDRESYAEFLSLQRRLRGQ